MQIKQVEFYLNTILPSLTNRFSSQPQNPIAGTVTSTGTITLTVPNPTLSLSYSVGGLVYFSALDFDNPILSSSYSAATYTFPMQTVFITTHDHDLTEDYQTKLYFKETVAPFRTLELDFAQRDKTEFKVPNRKTFIIEWLPDTIQQATTQLATMFNPSTFSWSNWMLVEKNLVKPSQGFEILSVSGTTTLLLTLAIPQNVTLPLNQTLNFTLHPGARIYATTQVDPENLNLYNKNIMNKKAKAGGYDPMQNLSLFVYPEPTKADRKDNIASDATSNIQAGSIRRQRIIESLLVTVVFPTSDQNLHEQASGLANGEIQSLLFKCLLGAKFPNTVDQQVLSGLSFLESFDSPLENSNAAYHHCYRFEQTLELEHCATTAGLGNIFDQSVAWRDLFIDYENHQSSLLIKPREMTSATDLDEQSLK